MHTKKLKFLLVFFIAFVSGVTFTACSSDDEEESGPSYNFQTKEDQEVEKKLMETKWKLTKIEYYDEDDKIIDVETDRDWSCYLFSEKAPESVTSNELCRLAISYNGDYSFEDAWNVFCDGFINMPFQGVGRIISLNNGELITSDHKIVIPDLIDFPQSGKTMYWERVDVDDDHNGDNNDEQDSSLKYATWENGVLKNGTNTQPYLGSWLETYYLDYEGDRWVQNTLYVFNDDGTYELHKRYVGTSNEYNVSKGTYRVSGDKLYLTEENKTEKSKNLTDVSREMLRISGDRYYPTTLTTLDDNSSIDTRETPVVCRHYYDDKVYSNIVIAPKWGVDYYTYSVDNGEEIEVSGKRGVDKAFKDFDFGTTHTYKIKAYSKGGKQFPTVTGEFTVPGSQGTINYFTYNGKVYPIYKVEMQTKHATSSSGANFKYLRMFYSDDTFLQFQYATHSWDGIDNMWPSGTYKIVKESNEYYKYACLIRIDGSFKEHPEGKLVIKSGSNGSMTYDIDMDICRGHFSGQVK